MSLGAARLWRAREACCPRWTHLWGVPQPDRIPPGGRYRCASADDAGIAARRGAAPAVVFAVLVHDLGKALTPQDELPQHKGHEAAGVPLIRQLAERLRVPTEFRDLALLVSRFHTARASRDGTGAPRPCCELLESCRCVSPPRPLRRPLPRSLRMRCARPAAGLKTPPTRNARGWPAHWRRRSQ